MKSFYVAILSFLLLSNISICQSDNSICGTNTIPWIDSTKTVPFYLRPGFGETTELKLAVIFVDFPDGRVNGVEQVFNNSQLSQIVPNK